jgi:hypothetical protein
MLPTGVSVFCGMLTELRSFVFRLWPVALCFALPALLNLSPFYDYDSGDYIYTGLRLSSSLSRPPFYGLFILLSSGMLLLMGTVVAQSFLLAWSLEEFLRLFDLHKRPTLLAIAAIWSVLTPIARLSSQIMPDVFCTAFLLLMCVWIYSPDRLSSKALWVMAFMGMSHNALLPFFAVGALFQWLRAKSWRQSLMTIRALAIPALVLLVVLLGANYGKVKRLTMSPAGSAFQAAKFAHTGALQSYLKQNCPDEQIPLCHLKDSIPKDFNTFLWSSNGAIHAVGGIRDGWKALEQINQGIRSTPEAMQIHWNHVLNDFTYQCIHHNWIVGVYVPGTNTEHILNLLLPLHKQAAERNLWNRFFPTDLFNLIYGIALVLGFLASVMLLVIRRLGAARYSGLLFIAFALIHHGLVALYSIPDNRLAARVSVLLVLPLLILVFRDFSSKVKSASGADQPPQPEPSRADAI